jgi:hypothetical protein
MKTYSEIKKLIENLESSLDGLPSHEIDAILKKNPERIRELEEPSKRHQYIAVRENPSVIKHIKKPDSAVQELAFAADYRNILNIRLPTPDIQIQAVRKDPEIVLYLLTLPPAARSQQAISYAFRQNKMLVFEPVALGTAGSFERCLSAIKSFDHDQCKTAMEKIKTATDVSGSDVSWNEVSVVLALLRLHSMSPAANSDGLHAGGLFLDYARNLARMFRREIPEDTLRIIYRYFPELDVELEDEKGPSEEQISLSNRRREAMKSRRAEEYLRGYGVE